MNDDVIYRGGGSPQARFYRGDYDDMFCDLMGDCPEEDVLASAFIDYANEEAEDEGMGEGK